MKISKLTSAALAVLVAAGSAGAQVTVTGTTLGCFGMGCTPTSSTATFPIDATGTSIAFAGTSFTGTTNPFTGAFTVGNFGTFVLNGLSGSTPNATFATPFTLAFQLSAPGATTTTTTFTVNGFVGNINGQGARDISYGGGTASFSAGGATGTILVDGGQIGVNATDISGRVTATANIVPEPSTYALMATGFVGLAGAVVRRRNVKA